MQAITAQAKPGTAEAPDINRVFELCAADMAEVDKLIRASLDSNVVLIRQITEYIIGSGGKRLRPMLVVLAARACGYNGGQHITLAAVIEFIHTATLLHDDVVDLSTLRRGRPTANAEFGNAPSILVGDFLYTRAFQLMVQCQGTGPPTNHKGGEKNNLLLKLSMGPGEQNHPHECCYGEMERK